MKINDSNRLRGDGIKVQKSDRGSQLAKQGSVAAGSKDHVAISSTSQQVQGFHQEYRQLQALDMDKLKDQIQSGQYHPDPKEIASAMMEYFNQQV